MFQIYTRWLVLAGPNSISVEVFVNIISLMFMRMHMTGTCSLATNPNGIYLERQL